MGIRYYSVILLFLSHCQHQQNTTSDPSQNMNSTQCIEVMSTLDTMEPGIYKKVNLLQGNPPIMVLESCGETFQVNADQNIRLTQCPASLECPTKNVPAVTTESSEPEIPQSISENEKMVITGNKARVWMRADAFANQHASNASLESLGPYILYAWLPNDMPFDTQFNFLKQAKRLSPDSTLALLSPSYRKLESEVFSQSERIENLKELGVTIMGYNTEGMQPCLQNRELHTPCEELFATFEGNSLKDSKSDKNYLIKFIQMAKHHDFSPFWGPIRTVLDGLPNADAQTLVQTGLKGIGVQEQNYIQNECAENRLLDFAKLKEKFASSTDFTINVQLMSLFCKNLASMANTCPSSDPTYYYCVDFALALGNSGAQVGIWTNANDDSARDAAPFIEALRNRGY